STLHTVLDPDLLRAGRLLRRLGLALLGPLFALRARDRALHVHAAAEVGPFGDRHARRDDVAVDRAVVTDVDLLGRRDIADDLAQDDHLLGEHLGPDPAVGPDRQHMVLQLDLALDVAFNRQVLAAIQLALDDNGLADVHHVAREPAAVMARGDGWRDRGSRTRRRSRRRRRLHRLVTLPHVFDLHSAAFATPVGDGAPPAA